MEPQCLVVILDVHAVEYERLAALTPRPRINLLLYYGVPRQP